MSTSTLAQPYGGKRIMILSSRTGGGHQSAAMALEDSLTRLARTTGNSGLWITINQVMDDAHIITRHCAQLYNFLLRYHQHTMKYYYWAIEHLKPYQNNLIMRACSRYGAQAFERFGPTALVSVHPMVQHFMAFMLKQLGLTDKIPLITVVTDPCTGFWKGWACDSVHRYYVASPDAKQQLEQFGVDAQRIEVKGMPVHAKFKPLDGPDEKLRLRAQLGLDPNRFTVLVNPGWIGGGNVPSYYQTLIEQSPEAVQLLFLTGNNPELEARTKAIIGTAYSHRCKVLGFSNEMQILMQASDTMISKLGGLTTFEALACHLPIMADHLTEPMPQERGTAEFIDRNEAGVLITSPQHALQVLDDMVGRPNYYSHLKSQAACLGQPGAVDRIAEGILQMA